MDFARKGLQAPLVAVPVHWAGEVITSTYSEPSKSSFVCEKLSMFATKLFAWLGVLCVCSCAQDTACSTSITANAIPPAGSGVQLQSYSYCGGVLDVRAYIEVSCCVDYVCLRYSRPIQSWWPLYSPLISVHAVAILTKANFSSFGNRVSHV